MGQQPNGACQGNLPAVGSPALGDVNSVLTSTLGGGDWSGLQPGLRPQDTHSKGDWLGYRASLHAMDGEVESFSPKKSDQDST
jgi:hypothetical protein